jgi:hypothetical protein
MDFSVLFLRGNDQTLIDMCRAVKHINQATHMRRSLGGYNKACVPKLQDGVNLTVKLNPKTAFTLQFIRPCPIKALLYVSR